MELISVNGEEMSYKYGNEMLHICGSVLQIICLTNETVRHKNGVVRWMTLVDLILQLRLHSVQLIGVGQTMPQTRQLLQGVCRV